MANNSSGANSSANSGANSKPISCAIGCAICGGAGLPDFASGAYRMYRCADCATVFVHPQPSSEELDAFYAQYHMPSSEGGWYDEIEDRMQADFPAKIDLLRTSLSGSPGASPDGGPGASPEASPGAGATPSKLRVLDVGCGKGHFVKACTDAGFDAMGIDLSTSGVRYASETLGVRALQGSITQRKGELGEFDGATFWATIEHVPDPLATLREIASVLRPGGTLLLDTGIAGDWLDRLLPGRTQWYDPPQHLWVYSEAGMRRLLAGAGLEVVSLDPCFERSGRRRLIRKVRGAVAAGSLRFAATIGRLKQGPLAFTRYPLGNLMSVVARRPGDGPGDLASPRDARSGASEG